MKVEEDQTKWRKRYQLRKTFRFMHRIYDKYNSEIVFSPGGNALETLYSGSRWKKRTCSNPPDNILAENFSFILRKKSLVPYSPFLSKTVVHRGMSSMKSVKDKTLINVFFSFLLKSDTIKLGKDLLKNIKSCGHLV